MSHTYDGSRLSSRFANDWLFMTNLSVCVCLSVTVPSDCFHVLHFYCILDLDRRY